MSVRRSSLGAQAATKTVVNYFSSGGVSLAGVGGGVAAANAKEVLSVAMGVANTLTQVVSVTGSGQCPFLAAYSKDTTSRQIRLQVTVDGTVVFDAPTDSIVTVGRGTMAAGRYSAAELQAIPATPIRYNTSLVIKIASSIVEGANTIGTAYSLT